jgi:hypothetical protein
MIHAEKDRSLRYSGLSIASVKLPSPQRRQILVGARGCEQGTAAGVRHG